ncbi:SH3 domain and tetratricopeptide repeat-containing protein 2 isoform X2 [Spea bombifrons]|uniref:SH3 domain and tetratricopeptide repeat-containing protein 2 isoform X2 n=2 Tax=Spea bombifrons TaxID=233779 RepID=UPI00234AB64F|nr:SH3 domain and tetratricopeptide repeat-containing protein 2 isoform X2 [Spea bombifrons]
MEGLRSRSKSLVYKISRNDKHPSGKLFWSSIYHSQKDRILKSRENQNGCFWKNLQGRSSETVSSIGKGAAERADLGLLASWSHWQGYNTNRKERCLEVSTMASEISLSFSILRRSTQGPNVQLQEVARKTLWALENDNKEMHMLFKELSARLVSVQAQKDVFMITFKTIEEIWKFTTYLSLGFVACSLEHLLFDERYWLNSALVEDTEIQVSVNQDELATLYLGLLLQEGNFYARAVVQDGGPRVDDGEESEFLSVSLNDVVHLRDIGEESSWEGQSLSTGDRGLMRIISVEPLPHPFYQWFLKTYPTSCYIMEQSCRNITSQTIGEGLCTARENHTATGCDELSYARGDSIEVVGFYVPGLKWFVGRSPSNGATGFVQTKHVDPSCLKALGKDLLFLSEEERSSLNFLDEDSQQSCVQLLSELAQSDISSVYRLDGLDPSDTYHKASSDIRKDFGESNMSDSLDECEGISSSSKCSASEKSSPESEWKCGVESFIVLSQEEIDDPKFFVDLNAGEMEDSEVFDPVLTFLNKQGYQPYYQPLYDLSMSFLKYTFYGFSEEEDLVFYLETSRNWAKKLHMSWAHVRCCFLLGRICAKRMKLSQARVYFEEALSAISHGFLDLHLLAALYDNLSAIYLKQNLRSKQELLLEKAASLLICLHQHNFSSEHELEVLKYLMKKAIIVNNTSFESRVCFLIFRLLHQLGRYDEALPFVERLQFLFIAACSQTVCSSMGVIPILSYLYDKKYLPHVALASARLCKSIGVKIMPSPMWRVGVVMQNISRITGCPLSSSNISAQSAPYLKHALSCSYESGDVKAQRTLCLILSKLYLQHSLLHRATTYSKRAVELGRWSSEDEAFEASLFLGWMYTLNGEFGQACQILEPLLESMQETDSTTQCGVVHNLLANAQKMDNKVVESSRGYSQALKMATEMGNRRNQAIALANFGRLSVFCKAVNMAERYFLKSIQLYMDLQGSDEAERELVQVLHWLGQILTEQKKLENGKLCYELALVYALKVNNLKSQLKITKELCNFYNNVSPATGAHIAYCEHLVHLVQLLKDRKKEEELLGTLSQLYQSLNTARSLRKALDYTKQSLRIAIDLGLHDRAAESWLQAGRLYYLLKEEELVEIYLHAGIQASQKSDDLANTMHLYEAAGDIFFHGIRMRESALPFYKEGALPLAKKLEDIQAQLRLFHKLTQLLVSYGNSKASLEYAAMAVRLSPLVGEPLHELVAFHRLAGVYHSMQIYEVSEYCYLKALSLCSTPMQHAAEAGYYLKVYWRLGEIALLRRKDAEGAATYLLLALAAAIEIGNEEFQLVITEKLAELYLKYLKDKEQAEIFMKQKVQLTNKT